MADTTGKTPCIGGKEETADASTSGIKLKEPKTYEEQLAILKSRKLFVENDAAAVNVLKDSNYYRLRGYYIHLQKDGCDHFLPSVSFNGISALHEFDNELRSLLLRLLLDFEIVARTRIAYAVAHKWGAIGYRDIANYGSRCTPEKFTALIHSIEEDLKKSRERFIQTHRDKYSGQFPIWVAVEVMSFGDLSKLYHMLPDALRKEIAATYDGLDETLFTNWIQCAAMLRNICAHNSRIYARSIPTPVAIEKNTKSYIKNLTGAGFTVSPRTLFAYLLALKRISRNIIWRDFISNLDALFNRYSGFVEIIRLGFPRQWKSLIN